MSEQTDGTVTYTGNIIDIKTVVRGKTAFELTEIRLDTGREKNSLVCFEAKKNDPLIVADVYDKVKVKLWVNFREWQDKVFVSCSLKEMTVLERADKGVPTEIVNAQTEEEASKELPFQSLQNLFVRSSKKRIEREIMTDQETADLKRLYKAFERIAKAHGLTTPLELIAMAKDNEENYAEILARWIEETHKEKENK